MKTTISHEEFRKLTDAYLDSELDEDTANVLRSHAEECEECRKYTESRIALRGKLRDAAKAPEGLRGRIMDTIRAQASADAEVEVHVHTVMTVSAPARRPKKYRIAMAAGFAAMFMCLALLSAAVFVPLLRADKSSSEGNGEFPLPDCECFSADEECGSEKEDIVCDDGENDAVGTSIMRFSGSVSSIPQVPDTNAPEAVEEIDTLADAGNVTSESAANVISDTIPSAANDKSAKSSAADQNVTAGEKTDSTSYTDADTGTGTNGISADRINHGLLMLAGILAAASLVAFLISLSSVRQINEKRKNENHNGKDGKNE